MVEGCCCVAMNGLNFPPYCGLFHQFEKGGSYYLAVGREDDVLLP
jgi:hypothetical protein